MLLRNGASIDLRMHYKAMAVGILALLLTEIVFLGAATSTFSGELLPFPNDTASQRLPNDNVSQRQSQRSYASYREEIATLDCNEMNELNRKLTTLRRSASDNSSIGYYSDLIRILDETKRGRCM